MSLKYTAPTSGVYEIRVQGPSPVDVKINGKTIHKSFNAGGTLESIALTMTLSPGDEISSEADRAYMRRLSSAMSDWHVFGDHPLGLDLVPLTPEEKTEFVKDAFGLTDSDLKDILTDQ